MKNIREAVMVVDYQNWFAKKETNELYVNWWESIAPIINKIMKSVKNNWWIIVASKDMHRNWNISFAQNFKWKVSITEVWPDNPKAYITSEEIKNWTEEKNGLNPSAWFTVLELKEYIDITWWKAFMWPNHCVVNSEGSEYYKELNTDLIDIEVAKWYTNFEHPYSAVPWIEIWNKRSLIEIFEDEKVDKIKVVWLASDWCVKDTALDLIKSNKFEIELILEATKAVNPTTEASAIKQMKKAGIKIID